MRNLLSILFISCVAPLLLSGCQTTPSKNPVTISSSTNSQPEAKMYPVHASAPQTSPPTLPVFNADTAFDLLRKQVEFGPRVLGTEAHHKALKFLQTEMSKYADQTVDQQFFYRGMRVTNIIGIFHPAGKTVPDPHPVLLLAHWDTRPIADGPFSSELKKGPFHYGPQGWNRTDPIPGADDGASGVAVLLELARMFHEHHPSVGVLLLLDDGEDYGDFEADNYRGDGVELGSRYFAKHYQDDSRFGHPAFGILLDMVGGKNMVILPEQNSQNFAPSINDEVFGTANSLGYADIFQNSGSQDVDDDHIALNTTGHIATIDLIQPLPAPGANNSDAYLQWHTLQDDVSHCSKRSLKAVGDTVAAVIYNQPATP